MRPTSCLRLEFGVVGLLRWCDDMVLAETALVVLCLEVLNSDCEYRWKKEAQVVVAKV